MSSRLLQHFHSLSTKGKASLGICAKNGVVIATDKKINSSLIDEPLYQKVKRNHSLITVLPLVQALQNFIGTPCLSRIVLDSSNLCSFSLLILVQPLCYKKILSFHVPLFRKDSNHQQNMRCRVFRNGTRFSCAGAQST